MRFSDIRMGQVFRFSGTSPFYTHARGATYQRVDTSREPLAEQRACNAINMDTGVLCQVPDGTTVTVARTRRGDMADVSSGLGIGGVGSEDYNINSEPPDAPEYDRDAQREGERVLPTGTTYGVRGGPNDRCRCGRSGDYNPSAGQVLCARHWDEY